MAKRIPRPKGIKWELPKIEGEEVVACEICGGEGVAAEIEIFHRGCRLGQAFPDAYEEKDGFLFFDPRKCARLWSTTKIRNKNPPIHSSESPDSLEAVAADIIASRKCERLVEWRERVAREKTARFRDWEYWGRPVPPFGDTNARLVIVGLAPAAHGGNRTGRIFTGDRSGDWLYAALYRTEFANQPASEHRDDGLRLTGAYVTAVVHCAPPGNKPTPQERDNCLPYLERELGLLPWRVIVALGSFAYDGVARALALRKRPAFAHGVEAPLPDGRVIICSYHPSQQNTHTGRLTREMFDRVFTRARDLSDRE